MQHSTCTLHSILARHCETAPAAQGTAWRLAEALRPRAACSRPGTGNPLTQSDQPPARRRKRTRSHVRWLALNAPAHAAPISRPLFIIDPKPPMTGWPALAARAACVHRVWKSGRKPQATHNTMRLSVCMHAPAISHDSIVGGAQRKSRDTAKREKKKKKGKEKGFGDAWWVGVRRHRGSGDVNLGHPGPAAAGSGAPFRAQPQFTAGGAWLGFSRVLGGMYIPVTSVGPGLSRYGQRSGQPRLFCLIPPLHFSHITPSSLSVGVWGDLKTQTVTGVIFHLPPRRGHRTGCPYIHGGFQPLDRLPTLAPGEQVPRARQLMTYTSPTRGFLPDCLGCHFAHLIDIAPFCVHTPSCP
jgi:hypothetical protein